MLWNQQALLLLESIILLLASGVCVHSAACNTNIFSHSSGSFLVVQKLKKCLVNILEGSLWLQIMRFVVSLVYFYLIE